MRVLGTQTFNRCKRASHNYDQTPPRFNSRSLRGLSKHGGTKRRVWGKIYLGIDAETLEVRAIKITGSQIGDVTVLPDLLGYIPEDD